MKGDRDAPRSFPAVRPARWYLGSQPKAVPGDPVVELHATNRNRVVIDRLVRALVHLLAILVARPELAVRGEEVRVITSYRAPTWMGRIFNLLRLRDSRNPAVLGNRLEHPVLEFVLLQIAH